MKCERCQSEAAADFRVLTDILDILVCETCADEARMMRIPVEAWDKKISSSRSLIRDSEMNPGTDRLKEIEELKNQKN